MTHKEMTERFSAVIERETELQKTDDWKKIIPLLLADLTISIGKVIDASEGKKND